MNPLEDGLYIDVEHWAVMEADVRLKAPEEACGFLAGKGNHSHLVIPVTNILHSQYRFSMDPQEELNGFLLAEKHGWDILAIYHSHPAGIDRPSVTDYKELTFPGIIYLIWYKLADTWQCKGYLMNVGSEACEVPLTITAR